MIIEDIKNVFRKDPAAKNIVEVLFCYPGLHSLWAHRVAHLFYRIKFFTVARIISHIARFLTGIEIHPGAKIGRRFFIDHGMGVVIGETAEIGDDCLIYKGVVLGGTTLSKGKRHPTLKDNVVIGSNAIVLGPITLGNNSKVGAGSVVLQNVPDGSTIVGVPGRIGVGFSKEEIEDLEHNKLPDPVADAIKFVMKEINILEDRLNQLESGKGVHKKLADDTVEKVKKIIEQEFDLKKPE